jgi:voltage-gated sodium channel
MQESATNQRQLPRSMTEQFRFYGSRSGIRPGRSTDGLVLHSDNGSGVYFELLRQARKIVGSRWFNSSIYVTILVGCILSGLETYQDELGDMGHMVTTLGDIIVVTIFCIEALLKICSAGRGYFKVTANLFDFAVTLISLVLLLATSTTAINPLIFSLFRLFRCLELVSHSRKLRWICAGFIGGIQSILYIVALMFLVIFVYAITGVFYFGRNDPYNFGSFRAATISLLKVPN